MRYQVSLKFIQKWMGALPVIFGAFIGSAEALTCHNGLLPNNPNEVYVDHGNGTVTDTRTGLMWKKCAEGLSGATCIGTAQLYNWPGAFNQAESSTFAGHADWRLPNIKELSSLIEECRSRRLSSIVSCLSPFMLRVSPAWPVGSQVHGRG